MDLVNLVLYEFATVVNFFFCLSVITLIPVPCHNFLESQPGGWCLAFATKSWKFLGKCCTNWLQFGQTFLFAQVSISFFGLCYFLVLRFLMRGGSFSLSLIAVVDSFPLPSLLLLAIAFVMAANSVIDCCAISSPALFHSCIWFIWSKCCSCIIVNSAATLSFSVTAAGGGGSNYT